MLILFRDTLGFFPYPANGAWDIAFDKVFSPKLQASFNGTKFDAAGWKKWYHSVNKTIGTSFELFEHGFSNVVAVPNSVTDKGGFVAVTGWQGGRIRGMPASAPGLNFTDAAFAVVQITSAGRKIVEFREMSNIPNTAQIVGAKNWTCSF